MGMVDGKVALVTGAATGIGLACAEAFARSGAITVLADIIENEIVLYTKSVRILRRVAA